MVIVEKLVWLRATGSEVVVVHRVHDCLYKNGRCRSQKWFVNVCKACYSSEYIETRRKTL